jgi:hypothetical protein
VPDERATLSAVTKLEHSTTWVWVWGSEPPAFSIGFEEPSTPADSGYTVLFADAPDPEDVAENGEHPAIGVVFSLSARGAPGGRARTRDRP